VHEMNEGECRALLTRSSMGRLGCAQDNQPYVVPVCLVYEPDYIYAFSTLGQKILWMRANPKVCIQIDEIETEFRWKSLIVNGRYQELVEPKFATERSRARQLLESRHRWWLNALGQRHSKSSKELLITPLFFRVQIASMTGVCAVENEDQGCPTS